MTVELRQMGTYGVQMKELISLSFLGGSLGSSCPDTRDFYPALAALVIPAQNIFSIPHISLYVSPSPSKLGRQSCRVTFS